MATALSMAAMAFLITIVLGYPYLNYLRRSGFGKKVRIEGPSSHIEKTGTPTMGGLLVSTVVLGLTVCLTLILYRESGRSILLPMGVMALTTLLGWYDDRLTLVGRKGEGLRARTKFALLGLIALAASIILWDQPNGLGINYIFVPGVRDKIVIGGGVIVLSLLAIMGAALAVVAMMLGQVLLLLFIGFVFVAEALSVMLQVLYFKMTRGKRLFRMAPLHHHF